MAKGPIAKCLDCGKLISLNFPLHLCQTPKGAEKLEGAINARIHLLETGHDSPLARNKEAARLLDNIQTHCLESLNSWESQFITELSDKFDRYGVEDMTISPRQLYKLRDIWSEKG